MVAISEFLRERVSAWATAVGIDFDVDDPVFAREVTQPLATLLGENLPVSDARKLIEARLSEQAPDLDGTVFADLVGKELAAVFLPLWAEVRAAVSRRRLDDERLLTGTDLADARDVWMIPPSEGAYSAGTLRVFYATPRAVQVLPTQRVQVPGRAGQPQRVYRPQAPRQYTLSEVRSNASGGRYYIDVAVVATVAGEQYDLEIGEAQGAVGFPGAIAVTNPARFRGGKSADNAASLLDRIRTGLTFRSPSSFAALEYALKERGITQFYVAAGGDPLMLRDRLYGPGTISGIPGGFLREPTLVPVGGETPYVSLGVAFDVWVSAVSGSGTVSAQITALRDEGAELLVGQDGTLSWDVTQPVDARFTLRTTGFRFTEVVELASMRPGWPETLLPVVEGDLVEFEGVFADAAAGRRVQFEVKVVVDGKELRLNPTTLVDPTSYPDYTGAGQYRYVGSNWRVLRSLHVRTGPTTEHARCFALTVPLTDARALTASGTEVDVSGYPALTRPLSTEAEVAGGVYVPRTSNVVMDASLLPVLFPLRAELGDALTAAPSRAYTYPRRYLYAEFLDSLAGTAEAKAVRARVHLLGPTAVAFPDGCLFASPTGGTQMYPMCWEFPLTAAVGTLAETDTLEIDPGGPALSNDLAFAGGPTVVGRRVRAGDWAHFYESTSSTGYFLPIVEVTSTSVRVASPDIPAGITGTLRVYQGTSRSEQLAEGRGPEGTYSVDVWLRERPTVVGVYVPADPPVYGTSASVDELTYLSQGFEVISPLPGERASARERVSIAFHSGYANDGEQLQGRSVYLHAPDERELLSVQDMVVSDETRPLCLTGLAKSFTPAYVVFSVFFVSVDLTAEVAAKAIAAEFEAANLQDRLEVSDLTAAVMRAGADYLVNGRVFVLRLNHLRQWESFSTKSAVPATHINRFVLQSVQAVRLVRPVKGQVPDETDRDAWLESFVYREGGFDAD